MVLAAKMGVDAEQTRQTLPRLAEVPFDSEYKFMATFHDRPDWLAGPIVRQPHLVTVKGAPDVVLDRCDRALWHGQQVPIGTVRDELLAANRQLSERGLRVLAFAAKDMDDAAMAAALADPMAAVTGLVFVALVGIVDPLRTEARDAVRAALGAGVDVRMITGDHTITARAIADELGLGPGVITGTELQHLSDDEVLERLPRLHVFGRVAPEDKLRLAKLMQQSGDVVAMTGDAVNDATGTRTISTHCPPRVSARYGPNQDGIPDRPSGRSSSLPWDNSTPACIRAALSRPCRRREVVGKRGKRVRL